MNYSSRLERVPDGSQSFFGPLGLVCWRVVRGCPSYITAFAPDLKSSVDELVALAGWAPPLAPAQVVWLTAAAARGASREQFVSALQGETDLSSAWIEAFLAHHTSPDVIERNG